MYGIVVVEFDPISYVVTVGSEYDFYPDDSVLFSGLTANKLA
jgi:hypothetical protein